MKLEDTIESLVIVRCGNCYQAVARFADPKNDFIVHNRSRSVLQWIIERRLRGDKRS